VEQDEPRGELLSSGRVSSSCYTSDSRVEQHEPRSELESSGRVSSSCYTSDARVDKVFVC
jgi:hypothetical protein